MADQYHTPPAVDPGIKAATESLKSTIVANYNNLARAMILGAVKASGITLKIGPDPLIQLTEKLIIPIVQKVEGGWADDPSDSGGPTMRGVILKTLRGGFDDIFIKTNVPQVKAVAQAFNAKYGNWKTDNAIGKQFLYTLCNEHKIGALFIYKFMSSKSARYPIVMMSEDPWLGYFFFETVWGSGPAVYGSKYANFDGVLQNYGWNGKSFANYIHSLGDKTPEVAGKILRARYDHIIRISKPGTKNNQYRKGWLNRLINNNDSNLKMVVKFNELFNLNTKGYFKFTPQEQEHLKRKAAIYKTFSIEIPN